MKVSTLADLLTLPDLEQRLDAIEVGLVAALGTTNPQLVDPGQRVVQGGGKRLRPVLTIAASACNDRWDADVVAAAISVELVHVGSLVHDDIMDAAAERRGVVTVNAREGANQAILVGDYLLARAGVEASKVSKEVAGALAQGIADLCDGQSREVSDAFNADRSVESFERSIGGKTGALMRTSAEVGALAGGFGPVEVAALATYGYAFGMSFQILDDVLDLVSTAELLGKPVLNDILQGVYTLPVIDLLSTPEGADFRARLPRVAEDPGLREAIRDAAFASGAIDRSLRRATDYNAEAAAALQVLPPSSTRDGLALLPQAYVDWVLETKTVGLVLPAG